MTETEQGMIQAICGGDQKILAQIYQQHREEFMQWLIKNYRCELGVAKDIYQVSVVVFYDNIVSGKLVQLSSSVKSYLFAIGKNKMREYLRQRQKVNFQTDSLLFDQLEHKDEGDEKIEQEKVYEAIEHGLKELGEPCKSLLEAFYYYRMGMDAICERLGYSNSNSAKVAKYKCLGRLRKRVGGENGSLN